MGALQTIEHSNTLPMAQDSSYTPSALAAMAEAEAWVKAVCAMAIRFPRDIDVVREKLLKECRRPSFAKTARYSKPIGQSRVNGFSIRFAEQAVASMRHIHVSSRTLAEDEKSRKIEITVWDAQEMVSYADEVTISKTLERKSIPKGQEYVGTRLNTKGELLYIIPATEDDLLNKVNAAKSKSIRNSGLRLIPGWLLDECNHEVQKTLNAEDAKDPDKAKREILDAFAGIGVSAEVLKEYLGHDLTNQPAEIQELRALYSAVRDGETTVGAILEARKSVPPPADAPTDSPKSGVAALKAKLQKTEPSKPEPQPALIPEQGEPNMGTDAGVLGLSPEGHAVLDGKRGYIVPSILATKTKRLSGKRVVIQYREEGERKIIADIQPE